MLHIYGCYTKSDLKLGCLYSLDWTTGLDWTAELTFELFLLSMIKIAVVLLAKLNLGIWVKLSGYLAKIQVSLKSSVLVYIYPDILFNLQH